MKLKKLLAVTLGMTMLCSIPVYANEADAQAVFQQMEEKNNELTDLDAYYDFTIRMADSANYLDARLEMNVKGSQINNPEQMRMNSYARMSMGEMGSATNGPGEYASTEIPMEPMTFSMYYENGMYYMDMAGQKVKYPMPIASAMQEMEKVTSMADNDLAYLRDMKLRTEGEDRIISFTMNMDHMNGLLDQILSMGSMKEAVEADGVSIRYKDVSGEYVVNPDGYCSKVRMKMTMEISADGETMSITMDGDIGFANPGQPVAIQTPNLAEYQLMQ